MWTLNALSASISNRGLFCSLATTVGFFLLILSEAAIKVQTFPVHDFYNPKNLPTPHKLRGNFRQLTVKARLAQPDIAAPEVKHSPLEADKRDQKPPSLNVHLKNMPPIKKIPRSSFTKAPLSLHKLPPLAAKNRKHTLHSPHMPHKVSNTPPASNRDIFTFQKAQSTTKGAMVTSNVTGTDACATLAADYLVSGVSLPTRFAACLSSFPFNRSEAGDLLATVWSAIVNVYPFANLARGSPTPEFPLNVKLRKQLSDMKIRQEAGNYSSEWEFQKELSELIDSLQDAHTSWESQCFTRGTAYTAFPLVQVVNMGKTMVKVTPRLDLETMEDSNNSISLVFRATEALLGINVQDYAGAELIEINNIPVHKYVAQFASRVGLYRDQQARTNLLFFRPSFTPGEYYPGLLMRLPKLPENNTVTYKLRRVNHTYAETIEVPYIVLYSGYSFSSANEYYDLNCRLAPATNESQNSTNSVGSNQGGMWVTQHIKAGKIRQHKPKEKPSLRHKKKESLEDASEVTASIGKENIGAVSLRNASADVQVHLLSDNMTAVMTIPDFLGTAAENASISSGDALVAYLFELIAAYNTVKSSGAQRLIIDVSNNGGGFVVTGSFLTQLFFPEAGDPQFPLQFRAPPFAQAAYHAASLNSNTSSDYDYRVWINPNSSEQFPNASDFFVPLHNVTQNGLTALFSSQFVDNNFFALIKEYDSTLVPSSQLFNSSNIIILSNGLCYSTCGVFTYQMRQRHNVTFVSVGGEGGDPNPFSFAAGTVGFVVEDFMDFYKSEVLGLSLEDEYFQKQPPIPVRGRLSWTMAQSLGPKSSTVPQEFIYEPAQHKIMYTDNTVLSVAKLWEEVADYFP